MGDVGDLSLQATVAPRATTREGAVGVTIELRGTGNLPGQLSLPVVPGVEWLDQGTLDKLGPTQADRFGGTRTFSYVVKLHKEGSLNLGEVRLPYYNAQKGAYRVAHATLGIVNVSAGVAHDAGVEQAEIVLGGMPTARRELERPRADVTCRSNPLLGGAVRLAARVRAGARRARRIWPDARTARARGPGPDRIAKERRAEADAAARGGDGKPAMGAIARAIEATVLVETAVNLRGAASETSKGELEEAGVGEEEAEQSSVLRACEDARFSPDGVSIDAARETWEGAPVLERWVTRGASRRDEGRMDSGVRRDGRRRARPTRGGQTPREPTVRTARRER